MNSVFRYISQRPCPTKRLVVLHSYFATKAKAKPKTTYSNPSTTAATPSIPPNLSHSPSWNTISPSGELKQEKTSPPAPERPSEVPFQVKVSNSVHLIGYVHAPVQFETSSNGSFWAATVITQNPTSSSSSSSSENESSDDLPLWVPTVFEGDLAHIAAFHLKVNDRVYIAGKLSASLPHLSYNQFQASVQVIVHDLNFVEETVQTKKSSMICVPEKGTSFIEEIEKGTLNDYDNVKKKLDSFLGPWSDLIDNPKEWWDCRDKKLNGLVSRKYPDFKRKDDKKALWLDRAPKEVLKKISALEFDVSSQNSNEVKQFGGDEMWKDLLENPNKWWDNRVDKKSERAPDFKHKETGEGLWLSSSPIWVQSKLQPPQTKSTPDVGHVANGTRGTFANAYLES
ncbi:protein OSB2, chloroplastic-like isoform X2 [Humulus lupulus]|uniref:protein OSB2, chloroplastic-like isoform X2 n=1 Tax=Humulus lupulus TaxID=3486 RepID=UPI002B40170C|nr:protein OSB2, chloroplastic-like isoform X2 [Humulus lupulus]